MKDSINKVSLKLVEHLIYFSSIILSTESDVNIDVGKIWTDIDRLLTTWKFDHLNEIKQEFFQAVAESELPYRCTSRTTKKCLEENIDKN